MNDEHFINGDLSTDYLDRYSIIEKMRKELKAKNSDKSKRLLPAVASAIIQTEYVKRPSKRDHSVQNTWKFGGVA
jgi:acetyl-CoA/propionyl-CoA carboxylase